MPNEQEGPDSITASLRSQLKYEINGAELTNPEKFALEQKFGLTDPVLTADEAYIVRKEESRLG